MSTNVWRRYVRTNRHGWLRGIAIGFSAALLLVGCSGPQPPTPPAPDLHLPGVRKIRAVDTLPKQKYNGQIFSVAAYLPADPTGGARVLFLLNHQLYDVGADGRGLRPLPLPAPCSGGVAVIQHGQWATCRAVGIEFTALGPSASTGVRTFATNFGDTLFDDPTWAPDERHIAVDTRLESGCSVAIYQASASYDAFRLLAVLDFPYFATATVVGPSCTIFGLSWSPDGAWLALVQVGEAGGTIYGVRLAAVLPPLAQLDAQATPLTQVIPFDTLTPLATQSATPAWSYTAGGLALTFSRAPGRQVVRRSMATGAQEVLLTLPAGAVGALSWTPDSRQLAFVVDTPVCGDCVPVPSQLYVYTPSG